MQNKVHPFKSKLEQLENTRVNIFFKSEPLAWYFCKVLELREDDFDVEIYDIETGEKWSEACFLYSEIFNIRYEWTYSKRKEIERLFKKDWANELVRDEKEETK